MNIHHHNVTNRGNPGFHVVENSGPNIVSTNYFESEHARKGLAYLSVNAGTFRLLVPEAMLDSVAEMGTAEYVIISDTASHDQLELLFEDHTDTPFQLWIDGQQCDRSLPQEEDGRTDLRFLVYGPGCKLLLDRPARYRRVKRIPWMKPWSIQSSPTAKSAPDGSAATDAPPAKQAATEGAAVTENDSPNAAEATTHAATAKVHHSGDMTQTGANHLRSLCHEAYRDGRMSGLSDPIVVVIVDPVNPIGLQLAQLHPTYMLPRLRATVISPSGRTQKLTPFEYPLNETIVQAWPRDHLLASLEHILCNVLSPTTAATDVENVRKAMTPIPSFWVLAIQSKPPFTLLVPMDETTELAHVDQQNEGPVAPPPQQPDVHVAAPTTHWVMNDVASRHVPEDMRRELFASLNQHKSNGYRIAFPLFMHQSKVIPLIALVATVDSRLKALPEVVTPPTATDVFVLLGYTEEQTWLRQAERFKSVYPEQTGARTQEDPNRCRKCGRKYRNCRCR